MVTFLGILRLTISSWNNRQGDYRQAHTATNNGNLSILQALPGDFISMEEGEIWIRTSLIRLGIRTNGTTHQADVVVSNMDVVPAKDRCDFCWTMVSTTSLCLENE